MSGSPPGEPPLTLVAPPTASVKGILLPQISSQHIDLRRYTAGAQTQTFVERYWTVHWDVREQPIHEVQVIPHPCINIAFMPGADAQVHGVVSQKFTQVLSGSGAVLGVKFRPGGFTALTGADAGTLTDQAVPMRELFGPAADALAHQVLATDDDARRIALVDDFLHRRQPARDDDTTTAGAYPLVLRMVATMLEDRSITRVDEVAEQYALSVRTVQRLFQHYVGVGPKWVIRRYRMHDAAQLLTTGDVADPAAMAVQLGWFDQAHFARDFRRLVGLTPGEYSAACAAGVDHVARTRSAAAV